MTNKFRETRLTVFDFFIENNKAFGITYSKNWIDFIKMASEDQLKDLQYFFRYISLGANIRISKKLYVNKHNGISFRFAEVLSPNGAKKLIQVIDFPGFEELDFQMYACVIDVSLEGLNTQARLLQEGAEDLKSETKASGSE